MLFFPLVGFAQEPEIFEVPERTAEDYAWLDAMHRDVSTTVFDTAQWFDDFFAKDEQGIDEKARGEARIRLGWEPRSRDLTDNQIRFRFRMRLPNLQNRVDLVFSDYDEEDPDGQVVAARNEQFNNEDRFNLAIRWRETPDSGWSHRLGVGRKLQLYARSRYIKHHELRSNNHLRLESSAHYYNRDGFGMDFKSTLDHRFHGHSILRFNNNYFYRDQSEDWLWQHNLQHLYQFNARSALISGFYLEGGSEPNYRLEEYLFSVRLRENILREWLFYELEPFVIWLREENFSASYGLALRVEGYFGKR
jgi:hypothetical protein